MDKNFTKNKKRAILYLCIYFFIMIICSFSFTGEFLLNYFSPEFIIKYSNLIIYLFLFIIAIAFFYKPLINSLKDFTKKPKAYLKDIFKHILISYGLVILCGIVLSLLQIEESSNQSTIVQLLNYSTIFIIIDICILGPIVEEIVYRGIILNLIKNNNKKKEWLSIILSSLIFALMHVQTPSFTDVLANLPVFVLGCVIAHLYIKTDNLICSSIHHITINTISTVLILTMF